MDSVRGRCIGRRRQGERGDYARMKMRISVLRLRPRLGRFEGQFKAPTPNHHAMTPQRRLAGLPNGSPGPRDKPGDDVGPGMTAARQSPVGWGGAG